MDKILEEAIKNMIRRIEVLEDKISRISIPNKEGYYEPAKQILTPGTATPEQLGYIKKLGGKSNPSMTKQEASNEIDRLLEKQRDGEVECEIVVTEPAEVDTEDMGLDSEDLM